VIPLGSDKEKEMKGGKERKEEKRELYVISSENVGYFVGWGL